MHQFLNLDLEWFDKKYKNEIHESLERLYRYIEDLDLIKERAYILLEEYRNTLAQQTNKVMYIFSLVAFLFLPLTFLTGLFGVNVGGIPGGSYPQAFALFCGAMALLGGFLLYLFKRKRWL